MSVQIPLFDRALPKESKIATKVEELVGESFDVKNFVENFDVLAAATGGIAHLRRLVLELAVRGRLLAVDETIAKPALVSLRRPSAQGRRARSAEELTPPTEKEQPFQLPPNWVWGRVNDTGAYINGLAFKPSDWGSKGYPIIRIQNLTDPSKPIHRCARAFDEAFIVRTGDLLVSWSATLDVFIWDREPGVLNQHIFRVVPDEHIVEPRFLFHLLRYCIRDMEESEHAHGLVMKHINRGPFLAHPVPIPPVVEQKRIGAKVDQLMALCDELEARQTKKRAIGTRLTKSALEALTTAEGPEEFDAAWKRVVENFDVVIDRAEKIRDLRRAVVALALRGALLERRSGEGNASDLLSRIGASRATEAWTEDPGLPLPATWRWLPLAALVTWGPKNGYSPKAVEYETKVRSLTLTATTSGKFDPQYFKYIDEPIAADSDLWLRDGDVLVQRGNTIEYVGVAAIYRGPERTFIYPDLMMKFRVTQEMDLDFVHMALNGPVAREFIMSRASGTSGSMPKINQATLMAIPIPVPPAEEQRRIMKKVKAIEAICDQLEELLLRAEDRASRVAEAAVQDLV